MHETILGKRFCLPGAMRSEMRKQFGVLYRGDGEDTTRQMLADMRSPAKLIAIGDISTFNLLKCGTVPDLSVIDEKTGLGYTRYYETVEKLAASKLINASYTGKGIRGRSRIITLRYSADEITKRL